MEGLLEVSILTESAGSEATVRHVRRRTRSERSELERSQEVSVLTEI